MMSLSENKINVAWLAHRYVEGFSFFASNSKVMVKLNAQNFSMTCIYLEKGSDAPNILEAKGCRVVYLGQERATKIFNPFILWKLVKFLKDNPIDILHCHRHKATLYGALAAWITGIPVVFSHVHGLKRTRSALRRLTNRILYSIVNKVIAVSDAVKEDVMVSNPRLPSEKIIVIKNSFDVDKFSNINITKQESREILGLPQEAFIFGTVARLVPTKGQSYLIDAFAKVCRSIAKVHLVFVGSGRLESELKQQAAHLSCLDAITFAGQREDVPQVLCAFDSFVLPSIDEGLGVALIEAMSVSLPCIATAVGGIPEVIVNEKVGYLVPCKNPDALAKAMIECCSVSEDERRRIGSAACEMVNARFSEDIFTAELKKVYEDELRKKKI